MDLIIFGLPITIGTSSGGNERQREAMALVTFGLGITIGTSSGGNGRQREAMDLVTFELENHCSDKPRRQREATGGNGFGNFQLAGTTAGTRSGGNGKQREAMALLTFALGNHCCDKLGSQREATGGHGFGNFRAGEPLLGQAREATEGNGRPWVW